MGKYAVHCKQVAFSCKKHGESAGAIAVTATASLKDRIRAVHGSAAANELLDFEIASPRYGCTTVGVVSSTNYSAKKTTFLLFINHRAVESSSLKRSVEQTYSAFLPKGGKPFVYLSLEIDPARVDVNVHPTKREVNFLNEDEIAELICDEVRTTIAKVDTSRTFMTQSLLGTGKAPAISAAEVGLGKTSTPQAPSSKVRTQRPYENNLVRTDAKTRKITTMLTHAQSSTTQSAEPTLDTMEYEHCDREPTICRLATIKQLRAEVRESIHNELADVYSNHTYIGVVDDGKRIAAIQGGVKLFLVDYGVVSAEYFYQLGLTDFGNFGTFRFNPPLSLIELLEIEVASARRGEVDDPEFDWTSVTTTVCEQLVSRREMLLEYFSLEISDEGQLLSIPLMMRDYMPSLAKLPNFLLRLGPHVDWNDEKACFQTFLRELANFHVPEALPATPTEPAQQDEVLARKREQCHRSVEMLLFPAFRNRLIATKSLLKATVEVANLRGLYRVFERC